MTTNADAALGARVQAARAAKGLSLRTLARLLDVSPATVSQIENGRTGLAVSRLSRIADILEVSVAQILDTAVAPAMTSPTPLPGCPNRRWTGAPTRRSRSTRS